MNPELTNGTRVEVAITHAGQEYSLAGVTVEGINLEYALGDILEYIQDEFWNEFRLRQEEGHYGH